MKIILSIALFLVTSLSFAQSIYIDFESNITTEDFENFDGGVATVIDNPQSNGINTSNIVAQIVRDGGAIWAGSKITLAENLDFSTDNMITMKVFTTAPVGTVVKFKLEGNGSTERDAITTVNNEWEKLSWDFTGTPEAFNSIVFMFDFGNTGDGTENSTFLFDDVAQIFGGSQLDLPVTFEDEGINYTMTDFEGNASSLVKDPTDESNTVIKCYKTLGASPSAGTTIGTPAGFASDIALSLTDSKMTVKVWSPAAGIPVRLKVEDSNDPTHTCETETQTTQAGWETLEFDFLNQAPGTELLSIGLQMGWTYNMASIFFNFGSDGNQDGGQEYYFDDVMFGGLSSSTEQINLLDITIAPNPSNNYWNLSSAQDVLNKIELYNLRGELVTSFYEVKNQISIPNENLNSGIYIAKITSDQGISVVRLIKN